jgi:hypothetical protein
MARSGLPRVDQASAATNSVRIAPSSAVDGVYTAYLWNNLSIVLWFDAATLESIVAFENSCRERVQQFPHGLSSVHVMVPGGKSMPTAEARTELSRVIRDYAQYSAATAVVIPGAGFWASALRGMVTALAMLARSTVKPRICSDFADVAAWLPELHEQRTGVRLEPAELLRALQEAERAGVKAVA